MTIDVHEFNKAHYLMSRQRRRYQVGVHADTGQKTGHPALASGARGAATTKINQTPGHYIVGGIEFAPGPIAIGRDAEEDGRFLHRWLVKILSHSVFPRISDWMELADIKVQDYISHELQLCSMADLRVEILIRQISARIGLKRVELEVDYFYGSVLHTIECNAIELPTRNT